MDLTGIFLCIFTMYLTCKPAWPSSLVQVPDCPSSKVKWNKSANQASCTINTTYHCLLSVQKVLHEGCMHYLIINATAKGNCPQVRGINGTFAFESVNFNCTEDATVCPKIGSSYRSDELYKYPGCFGKRSVIQTTEKTTEEILTDTTYSTTNVAGIVLGSLAGICLLAVIIGVILWRCSKCRLRKQTSSSVELSNGATQYSPVSQKEPNGVSNDSPLPVQESNGGTNHTPVPQSDPQTRPGGDTHHFRDPQSDPQTRPGGDTNHTRVPQAEPNSRSNDSAHEVDGLPEADGGDQDDVQQDTESVGANESAEKGITIVNYNYYKDCQFNNQQKHKFENPAAVQFGSGNTANICSESTNNGV